MNSSCFDFLRFNRQNGDRTFCARSLGVSLLNRHKEEKVSKELKSVFFFWSTLKAHISPFVRKQTCHSVGKGISNSIGNIPIKMIVMDANNMNNYDTTREKTS